MHSMDESEASSTRKYPPERASARRICPREAAMLEIDCIYIPIASRMLPLRCLLFWLWHLRSWEWGRLPGMSGDVHWSSGNPASPGHVSACGRRTSVTSPAASSESEVTSFTTTVLKHFNNVRCAMITLQESLWPYGNW
jgi:hypothetical protein